MINIKKYGNKSIYTVLTSVAIAILVFMVNQNIQSEENVIIDSNMTFDEAVKGTKAPKNKLDSIRILNVEYYSFDNKIHKGQILINEIVYDDVKFFFEKAKEIKFPIKSVIPIVKFDWSDDKSMEANNSSAFNYRTTKGTETLSNHALGRAIDINPYINPVIYSNGEISPNGAKYNENAIGAFHKEHILVIEMKKRGWRWGGDWTSLKDYHHFDRISK